MGLDEVTDGRCALPIDVDGDGDLDVALLSLQGLKLLRNNAPRRHFARIRLEATRTQGHALGAIVSVRAGGVERRDYVRLTEGFMAQVPAELHFGLGELDRIDSVRVEWPSGHAEEWPAQPADRLLVLREGSKEARVAEVPSWPGGRNAAPAAGAPWTVTATTLEGGQARLAPAGRPAVLNFWAPDCTGCRTELPELSATAGRFDRRASFVGLCVGTRDVAAVRKAIATFGIPYPQFFADEELLRRTFGSGGSMPLPATFVYDREGRLRRAWSRPVTGEEVASLLDSLCREEPYLVDIELRGKEALLNLRYAEARKWFELALEAAPGKAQSHHQLGLALIGLGEWEGALAEFRKVVEIDPLYSAGAWFNIGSLLRRFKRPAEAIPQYRRALEIAGDDPAIMVDLAAAYAEAGEIETAIETAERAVRLAPESADARVTQGKILIIAGRSGPAADCFRRALTIDPDHADARQMLAALRK